MSGESELRAAEARGGLRRRVIFASSCVASFAIGSVTLISIEVVGGSGASLTLFGVTVFDHRVENHETTTRIIQIFPPVHDPEPVRVEPQTAKPKPTPKTAPVKRKPLVVTKLAVPASSTALVSNPKPVRTIASTPSVWDTVTEATEISSETYEETASSSVSLGSADAGASGSASASGSIEVSGSGVSVTGTSSVQTYSSASTTTIVNGVEETVTVSSGDPSLVMIDEPLP